MAKILIDIDDKTFGRIFHRDCIGEEYDYEVTRAIINGTVLPKGHTDLIDRQALIHSIEQKAKRLCNLDTINGLCGAVAIVFDALTIIEADKEVGNEDIN